MASSETVTTIEDGQRTIWLIGTAHVSKHSVDQVNEVIEEVRPDTVCIELCEARYTALTDKNRWRNLDIFSVIKEGKTLFLLANLAIGAYQRRLGDKLGVKPGAEMLAAAERAKEVGAEVVLADRNIQVTLKRTWGNLGLWKKLGLVSAVLSSTVRQEEISAEQVEELKQRSNLSEMMREFARVMPEVKEPLIDERDQYLISKVREAPGEKIVAVVGAGHVEGMQANFDQPVDRERLEQLPGRSKIAAVIKWLIPILVFGAFAYGYYKNEGQSLQQMLYAWVLPNSIVAALLTALAGGKLLSILCAFVASPITSLNPLLGTGMVVGLVEAYLRKPTVEDAERINDDVQSLRGVRRNPFTRVLLVAVASTIGSALGAWIGLSWLFALLGTS
jgi:pheromone shutdown-related protein TraB